MKNKLSFADLTHMDKGLPVAVSFPFGISLVASYAKYMFPEEVEVEIFKYPDDFKKYLEKNIPKIACFSNYSWNLDICHEFAKKIKEKNPGTVTVFGGPNFSNESHKQRLFLNSYTGIDFYIKCEGELGFVQLYEELKKFNFDKEALKSKKIKIGNCDYVHNGELIEGDMLPRIEDLEQIPSPYLTGILDKFFDGVLTPLIETARGCPFTCTYCMQGQEYFTKIKKYPVDRLKKELDYIVKRVKVPNLYIADANFGMYKENLEVCEKIAELRKEFDWPKYIESSLGKDKKMVLEAVKILQGGIILSAPVQSTDEIVLNNIKRKNISIDETITVGKAGELTGANSFSEIILCLPGDTKEAHIKSMTDMIDAGINTVRSHQLLMLPNSVLSKDESRKLYQMTTRFRLQPRCFGNYELYEETFPVAEIDELCVANNTMPYSDYLKCRSFDLTVEIFYNNGIFRELINILNQKNIPASLFVKKIEENITQSKLKKLYGEFLEETENSLWKTKEELEEFIKKPGNIDHYIKNELRNNEQLRYRAIAFFTKMKELHDIAFDSAKKIIDENGLLDEKFENFLNNLYEYSLSRKKELLLFNEIIRKNFNYDFLKMMKDNFSKDSSQYLLSSPITIEFTHEGEQKDLISSYLQQYGNTMNGLGTILSRSNANNFYRKLKQVD